jgi:hypothetical protein
VGFWTEHPNWGRAGVSISMVDEGLNDTMSIPNTVESRRYCLIKVMESVAHE